MEKSDHSRRDTDLRAVVATLCALLGSSLALAQVGGGAFITGKVLGLDGQPFENTTVSLYQGDSTSPIWQTATDDLGSFSFTHLTSGTYSIKAEPKTYKAKSVGQIRVTSELSKAIVIRFTPQDRLPGVAGCPTCVVFVSPDIPNTNAELDDPVWNFWMESPPHSAGLQNGFQIAYKSIYPKTASRAQLVVDLSAIAYDGFDRATYSRKGDTAFSKRLATLVGDNVTLDIIINPDPLYFAAPAGKDISRPMIVDLRKLRASQKQGVSLFDSPRYTMRLLGEASADYSYGVAAFPLRILNKRGWAPVNIEVWNHETNTPLTEATAFFCVIATEGDECGPKPPSSAIVDTLSGVDLAGRGTVPDAALHLTERGSDLVGLFRCNASYCPDHDYHRWEVGQSSAWLIARMTKTLNLLTSQEAFAQSHSDQIGSIDSQYITAGRAIFDNVFYSEQDDPALSTVVSQMRALASEGRRRMAAGIAPPALFARIKPSSSELLVVPWSLMVLPPDNPGAISSPLGGTIEIESPLPLQSYLTSTSCISDWNLLIPPHKTSFKDSSNLSDALNAVLTARQNFEQWIPRFANVDNDPSKFGNWLTSNVPTSGSTGIIVVSHHSTDGNTDAYFMDVDANGSIGPAASANVSRSFSDPSFAILDACGTGKPASSEFIHQLNRGGIYSIVSTAIDVNPEMAGKFLDLFLTHLTENAGNNDHSIGRAQWLAVRDLSKQFGSRAFVFSLNGNSAVKACVPGATRSPGHN